MSGDERKDRRQVEGRARARDAKAVRGGGGCEQTRNGFHPSHHGTIPAEIPPHSLSISVDEDAALSVLSADGATERVLVAAIPATWGMSSTEYAAVLAEARPTRLQLPPLLHARLPEVVAYVAEVGGAEAEVVGLALATVATLPAQELGAVLGALELPLGCATAADKLHGQSSLDVVVEVFLLFLLSCPDTSSALHFAPVVRLVALRALEESHLLHGEGGDSVLVTGIIRPRGWPPLLHHPPL